MKFRRGATAVAVLAVAAFGLAGCKPPVLQAACNGTLPTSTAGPITSPKLTETSGIAATRQIDGVYSVHNDSGNPASVYPVGAQGVLLGEYPLVGATNVDWEDIAIGPGPNTAAPWLYVGGHRRQHQVPSQRGRVPRARAARRCGAGRRHDRPGDPHLHLSRRAARRRGVMVDPITGQLSIVTKAPTSAEVFRAGANLPAGCTTVLTQVATLGFGFLPVYVTGPTSPPRVMSWPSAPPPTS